MSQLDALLPDDHPSSPAWRRLILIELRRRTRMVRRGVTLRLRKRARR
jgi:hypothetical protein